MKLLLFLLCSVFISTLNAQQQPAPCKESPEYRQLDFWVGEWEVFIPNGKKAGDSSIQRIIGDCVIFENYSTASGYTGKSFNIYNASLKKWQQFWVDSQGGVLQFSGSYSDGKLEYTAVTQDSTGQTMHKMTFFDMPDKSVRQLWLQSKDGGKQWTTSFDGKYVRKQ